MSDSLRTEPGPAGGAVAPLDASPIPTGYPELPQHSGWRRKALPALKVALAALGIAIVLALAFLRTWPPLNVVMSASMAPAIDTGDVVVMKRLDRPAQVGDIVAVHPPQELQQRLNYPDTIIHRIVRIAPDGKVYTRGDARKRRDPFTVQRDRIESRVIMTVPGAGRIVAFFTSPLGLIWLGLGALLFVLLPRLEHQRDLEEIELGSLGEMRHELRAVAQRVEGGRLEAGIPPPTPAATPPPPQVGDDELESEVKEMRETIGELVGAVSEYGEHLRSHTEVLQGMSAAAQDLAATVAALRTALPAAETNPSPQPTPPPPPATPETAAQQQRREAERFIAWQERRAAEIATAMGFRDPLGAARQAPLGDAADDEGIERTLWELAFENPDLLG